MYADNISRLDLSSNVEIEYGTVQGSADDRFIIQGQAGVFTAGRAFSCLVDPEPGDQVMYSRDDRHRCHILAIIERPAGQHATLSIQGDMAINSKQGKLSISGQNGLLMASPESLALVADEFDVMASKGRVSIKDVEVTGARATIHVSSLTIFAKSIDTVADRWTQRLKNSFRMIDGVDQTRAGDVLTTIKNLFSLRARQSAILAKKDIKIDAERIHMG